MVSIHLLFTMFLLILVFIIFCFPENILEYFSYSNNVNYRLLLYRIKMCDSTYDIIDKDIILITLSFLVYHMNGKITII